MIIYGKRGESGKTQEVLPARVMEDTEAWRRLTLLKKPPLPWALHRMDTRYIDLSWHVQVLQMISGSYFNGDCYSITIHGIVHELGYLKSISSCLDAVYRLVFFSLPLVWQSWLGLAVLRSGDCLPSFKIKTRHVLTWLKALFLEWAVMIITWISDLLPREGELHMTQTHRIHQAHTQLYTAQLKPLAKCMQLWTFTT